MNRWKRIIYYLIINVLVSAGTVVLVLSLWERTRSPDAQPLFSIGQVSTVQSPPTDVSASSIAPSPTPTPVFRFYEVVVGDTLGSIAAAYDVTIEELVLLNELEKPDSLNVGQRLRLPPDTTSLSEELEATAVLPTEILPTRTPPTLPPDSSPTPFPPGQEIPVTIVTIIGAGVLEDEYVLIRYDGEGQLVLQGWSLVDEQENTYSFPDFTLYTGGAISVFTSAGADSVIKLHWNRDEPVWETGELAYLVDPLGEIQATVQVP